MCKKKHGVDANRFARACDNTKTGIKRKAKKDDIIHNQNTVIGNANMETMTQN